MGDFAGLTRRARRARRTLAVAVCVLAGVLVIAGCSSAPRVPYTQQEGAAAVIPGIPGVRVWADDPAIATGRRSVLVRATRVQPTILALSGGGPMARSVPDC